MPTDFTGTPGDDSLTGTNGDDTIDMSAGGEDVVLGKNGNDFIAAGAAFDAGDSINGGAGDNDILFLNGDYSAGFTVGASVLKNVESLMLTQGHSYKFNFDATFVPSAAVLFNIDATNLHAGDVLSIDASAVTVGDIRFFAGAGDDVLLGTNAPGADGDQFYMSKGGNDTVNGGAGNDLLFFGHTLTAADKVDGGADFDELFLKGDYATHPLVFGATTMQNVEYLKLAHGHDYSLTMNDATVAAGSSLTVYAGSLHAGDKFIVDGSQETDGSFVIKSGAGDDVLTGGGGADRIHTGFGTDVVFAGAGDDRILARDGHFTAADQIDGGAGHDELLLNGDYTGAQKLVLNANSMVNIEKLKMFDDGSYDVTSNDATVAAGQTLVVGAGRLISGNTLTFDGSAETDGHFIFRGGDGGDVFTGGALSDTFVYHSASRSTGASYDTINAFDFASDKFNIDGHVKGIDGPIVIGQLDADGSFDAEMTAAMAGLNRHHAELFTASTGTLHGETFLVVDLNGIAGYQSGSDLVVHLHDAVGNLSTGDFI